MDSPHRSPPSQLMEEYRQQMFAMYRQVSDSLAPLDNWLDRDFPEPDIQRDRIALAPSPPEPHLSTPSPPIAETPFVGYLQVFTFTADQAEPIPSAHIIVSREDAVFANVKTNRDGYTPVIPLPTMDPALSLTPSDRQPYAVYTIQVNADGFRPVRHDNVPIYGDNYVTQPIALLPLLPGNPLQPTQNFVSGGPTNL